MNPTTLVELDNLLVSGDELVFMSIQPSNKKRKKKNKLEIFQDSKFMKTKKKSRGKEKRIKQKKIRVANHFKE